MRKLATLFAALVVSSSAYAATPAEGVPLQVRRGFFTETDIGGIFTVGGDNGYSNFQTYLQLGLGYQITLNDGPTWTGSSKALIPIGIHVGIGANAQNCWAGLNAAGACTQSDNFTMTFINASVGYLQQLVPRFYAGVKLLGGVTLLDPDPVGDGRLVRANIGGALSIEYATNMDHFSVGVDVAYRLIIGPNIHALMFYPRVQYTF